MRRRGTSGYESELLAARSWHIFLTSAQEFMFSSAFVSCCLFVCLFVWKYANITPIYKKKVQGQMLETTDQSVLRVLCTK